MQLVYTMFPFVLAVVIISYGLGMVMAQHQGLQMVHRFWVKLIMRSVSWVLNQIGEYFKALARSIRR